MLLLDSISFVFFLQDLRAMLERPWSEKCLILGNNVTKLFARFTIYGCPFVTPSRFRLLFTPLILAWACVGVALGVTLGGIERLSRFFGR